MCDAHDSNALGPIVVVDDDENEAFLARHCHAKAGSAHPLVLLEDGRALLSYMHSATEGETPLPHVVLLDLHLPGMDGIEVMRNVRRLPQPAAAVPVIIFTSSGQSDDRRRALAAGATGFKTKSARLRDGIDFFASLG